MIHVYWDKHAKRKLVVRMDYTDPVATWGEYYRAVEKAHAMVASRDPVSGTVIHNAGSTRMPPGNPFPHIDRAISTAPDNLTLVYMVISNPIARRMTEIGLRINPATHQHPARYIFVHSIDEAYRRIESILQP
ncbi:MAG: hypothetical protein AAF125_22105 [Chloroflexota bacterium]